MLAPNVIIPYDGTHATIPTGFTRDTRFDGKFAKGATADLGVEGGAATHTHTSSSHTHTMTSHTHTGTINGTIRGPGFGDTGQNTNGLAGNQHTHSFTSSANDTATSSSTSVTYAAASNVPPNNAYIFIKSTGYSFIPLNGIVFRKSTRATFTKLTNVDFVSGATTGANSGTVSGSTTNVHNINHNHDALTHHHADFITNYASSNIGDKSPNGAAMPYEHWHDVSINNSSQSFTAANVDLTTTETVEPAYKTLFGYKNNLGNRLPLEGDIAITTEDVPIGWLECNGTNGTPDMVGYYVRMSKNSNTEETGGSHTHTHAAQGHTHTANGSHTHTKVAGDYNGHCANALNSVGNGNSCYRNDHYHDSMTIVSGTPGLNSSNTTAESSNNEPPYVNVHYIQYKFSPFGSAALIAMGVR